MCGGYKTRISVSLHGFVCPSRNLLMMARFDRFYVNCEMVNIVKNSYIRPSGFSDHHMIVMVCGFPHHVCGSVEVHIGLLI